MSETITIQPAAAAGKDTQLKSTSATTNYGNINQFSSGNTNISPNDTNRALIQFDLSSIPASSIIESATLSLYQLSEASSNARTLRVYRMKQAWVEGNGGAGSGATWNTYDGTNGWQTAGGFGANDCEQTDIGSRAFSATEASSEYKDFSLTPSAAQEWVSGAMTNNGMMVKADTEADDRYDFASSDHATAGLRPKLVIVYSDAPPLPSASDDNKQTHLLTLKPLGVI